MTLLSKLNHLCFRMLWSNQCSFLEYKWIIFSATRMWIITYEQVAAYNWDSPCLTRCVKLLKYPGTWSHQVVAPVGSVRSSLSNSSRKRNSISPPCLSTLVIILGHNTWLYVAHLHHTILRGSSKAVPWHCLVLLVTLCEIWSDFPHTSYIYVSIRRMRIFCM